MDHTAKGAGMETVRRYAMLIDGDWVDTEDRFEIRSPATEEPVASVAKGGREHTDQAVAATIVVLAVGSFAMLGLLFTGGLLLQWAIP